MPLAADPARPDLAALSDWVHHHPIGEFANGQVRLVEPQIIREVVFEAIQWTAYQSGSYRLMQPDIVQVRHDKPLSKIDTIESVKHFAALQHDNE